MNFSERYTSPVVGFSILSVSYIFDGDRIKGSSNNGRK